MPQKVLVHKILYIFNARIYLYSLFKSELEQASIDGISLVLTLVHYRPIWVAVNIEIDWLCGIQAPVTRRIFEGSCGWIKWRFNLWIDRRPSSVKEGEFTSDNWSLISRTNDWISSRWRKSLKTSRNFSVLNWFILCRQQNMWPTVILKWKNSDRCRNCKY
jgi:hypothetical protein